MASEVKSQRGFFRDLFMGPENKFWDYARILLWSGNLVLFGGAFWNVFGLNNDFNMVDFASAFSILNGPTILAASFRDKNAVEIRESVKE